VEKVVSRDATVIAYDRLGDGPPVVIVAGAMCDRSTSVPLAEHLASSFTVFNYDRRGRGDSGDSAEYSVDREIDDLAAVIDAAGGSASVCGISSGAALALVAAAAAVPITKLAMWEPPFGTTEDDRERHAAYQARLTELLAAGKRGDAVELFFALTGMPPEAIAGMRGGPWWPTAESLAHTLAYDAAAMGDGNVPAELVANVTVPTLAMVGGASMAFMHDANKAVAAALPNVRQQVLPEQQHNVDPGLLATAVTEFFTR
jgi:pimeloyl-ACP methyl ester carboxylesterase